MADKTPQQKLDERKAMMECELGDAEYATCAVSYGVHKARIGFRVAAAVADDAAEAAFTKRLALAKREASASQTERATLHGAAVAKAEQAKAVKQEVNPEAQPASPAEQAGLLAQLQASGVKLTRKQAEALAAHEAEAGQAS